MWKVRESLRPWSPPLLVAARVGAATAIAGVIGAALGMERAYWTMAAAVLVLHQSLDWARSLQRGVDTFIGCMTGLVILAMTTPRTVAMRIPQELVNTLAALTTTLGYAAEGEVTAGAARRARRDLQHRIIALLQAYDASVGATLWHRDVAERSWPAVVAAQRLGYRVLSTCWSLENAGAVAAPEMARTLFGPDGWI